MARIRITENELVCQLVFPNVISGNFQGFWFDFFANNHIRTRFPRVRTFDMHAEPGIQTVGLVDMRYILTLCIIPISLVKIQPLVPNISIFVLLLKKISVTNSFHNITASQSLVEADEQTYSISARADSYIRTPMYLLRLK